MLTNLNVIITGAGGGIGRAVAQRLAREGMNIILFGGRNIAKLEETRQLVEQFSKCAIVSGELTDISAMDSMLADAVAAFGGIDVLINNAGIALSAPVELTTEQQYDAIMNINAKVPFFMCQKTLPYLRKSSAPSIINIASVVAHSGYPLQSAYSASKHALLGFTKSLAAECYKEGIRVHAISPGGVFTDMIKISRPDLTSDGMIVPEDIAEIVHFFLANRGNAVIDEIIVHRLAKQPFLV